MEQSTMMQAVGGILARNIDPRDLMYLSMEELEEAGKSIAEDIHEEARKRREYLEGDTVKEVYRQIARS